jgi:hypothetical protein
VRLIFSQTDTIAQVRVFLFKSSKSFHARVRLIFSQTDIEAAGKMCGRKTLARQ